MTKDEMDEAISAAVREICQRPGYNGIPLARELWRATFIVGMREAAKIARDEGARLLYQFSEGAEAEATANVINRAADELSK